MIYMTKFFLILFSFLFLSSCSALNYISYSQVVPLIKTATVGVPDIQITPDFIEERKYSFAKVKVGRSAVAILVLVKITDDVYEWVGGSGEKLYTFNGKIIKTENTLYDIEVYNFRGFSLPKAGMQSSLNFDVFLQNPDAFITQSGSLSGSVNNTQSKASLLVTEELEASGFRWRSINTYYANQSNQVIKTVQYIHPNMPRYEISFYYK